MPEILFLGFIGPCSVASKNAKYDRGASEYMSLSVKRIKLFSQYPELYDRVYPRTEGSRYRG